MPIEEASVRTFLNNASEAAKIIIECVEADDFIHVVSHLDADGLAAAGIIGKALWRLGANFRLRIQQWVDERIILDITTDKPKLVILTDLGSGYLNV